MEEFEEKYMNTHVYYEEKTKLTINIAGFQEVKDLEEKIKKYSLATKKALKKLESIEVF
jgi:hypothetical protein